MAYKIILIDNVLYKHLPKLSAQVKETILSAIEKKLLSDPVKFGKPLRYNLNNHRSLRVGDYRVIYQIEDNIVKILVIKHRRDCYE